MSQLKVICPNCRHLLIIEAVPGISDKMLVCPECKLRAKVAVYQQTALGKGRHGGDNDDEPTQITFETMDRTIGALYFGKEQYSLHMGENTVGRKARTGHAEVQISTDRYMSRQHAVITITEGRLRLKHTLQPTNPKNAIVINGKVLANSDAVILQWGDQLLFGHTQLIFDRPDDDEKTLV